LVTAVHIIESEPPHVFDREVTRALSQWKFSAEGEHYVAEIEVGFTLKDE
jgi:outer membrane biosynthesis protein TonB